MGILGDIGGLVEGRKEARDKQRMEDRREDSWQDETRVQLANQLDRRRMLYQSLDHIYQSRGWGHPDFDPNKVTVTGAGEDGKFSLGEINAIRTSRGLGEAGEQYVAPYNPWTAADALSSDIGKETASAAVGGGGGDLLSQGIGAAYNYFSGGSSPVGIGPVADGGAYATNLAPTSYGNVGPVANGQDYSNELAKTQSNPWYKSIVKGVLG